MPLPPPPSPFTIVAITEGGAGRGYDLTDELDGLSFSNVDPGGDEVCSFTLHRSWFAENPEVGKGNLIRVMASIDTLWVGRVEEIDRASGDSESLQVTAYGLGNRLGDVTFREIFIDKDLSKWGPPSAQRTVNVINAGYSYAATTSVASQNAGAAAAALFIDFTGVTATATFNEGNELWYYAGGVEIGQLLFDQIGDTSTTWVKYGGLSNDDQFLSGDFSFNYSGIGESLNQGVHASEAGRKYALLYAFNTNNAFTGQMTNKQYYANVAVVGTHSLALGGTWPNIGFTADQIVGNIVGRASGIAVRQIDSFAYLIQQFTVTTPTTPKDSIATVNEYADASYGTWGPNSPLDTTTDGYFDYTQPDTATQHWLIPRSNFEPDLSFHTELSSLYDTVDAHWTDIAGVEHTERFSIYSADLATAGLSPRVYPLECGTNTAGGAAILAQIFLNIFAGFAPARGGGTLLGNIRHYRRGVIPAYYLRADGSNMRIPDILPAETTFSLDSTPDRRTTFPIKRVTVDLSNDTPKTNVELDQATQALSVLLAQEAAQAEQVG